LIRREPAPVQITANQASDRPPARARAMAGIDWEFVLLLAATLALTGVAMGVMLFAL
jgi:hypothetical protein